MLLPLKYMDGVYRTGKVDVSLFAKTFPSLRFYAFVVRLVTCSGRRAKKGLYSIETLYGDGLSTIYAIEKIGVKVEISGIENLSKFEGPCVVASNHMSTFETFALTYVVGSVKLVTFVVKDSLLRYPFFGDIIKTIRPIAVTRKNPREDLKTVLTEGVKRLKEGFSVLVFPQAVRSQMFDPAEFNTLGVKLAKSADVPIVPLALKTDAWGTGKMLRDFGKIDPSKNIYLSFGEPMRIEGRGAEEHKKTVEFIDSKLKLWSGK